MHVHAFLGDWEGLVAETQADSQSERGALGCGPFWAQDANSCSSEASFPLLSGQSRL